jgi:hypothetical protein
MHIYIIGKDPHRGKYLYMKKKTEEEVRRKHKKKQETKVFDVSQRNPLNLEHGSLRQRNPTATRPALVQFRKPFFIQRQATQINERLS